MRIAIIGAGPAGAMAAFRLARAGAPVRLFDASHPREKACGGGLTGRALSLVADVIDIAALPSVTIASAVVEGSADEVTVPLIDRGASPASSLVVVSRTIFDRALADAAVAAGATLIDERVVDIARRGTRFIVRTTRNEYDADYVIGADGANSLVRKRLAQPFSRAQLSVAAGFFVHGATSRAIAVKTMREQPGDLWSFPRPDHLAIGVCAAATDGVSSAQLRAQALTWIRRNVGEVNFEPSCLRGPCLRGYAWPIPSIGSSGRRADIFGGAGWLLVGDAAGLVDPLTREGIYFALLSGQWAADALATGTVNAAATAYESRINAEIQPELALAARLSRLFFTPAFGALLVRALAESASIRQVFADLVAGVQPYGTLRRRLLATRHWTLAIRMLAPVFAGKIRPALLSRDA